MTTRTVVGVLNTLGFWKCSRHWGAGGGGGIGGTTGDVMRVLKGSTVSYGSRRGCGRRRRALAPFSLGILFLSGTKTFVGCLLVFGIGKKNGEGTVF